MHQSELIFEAGSVGQAFVDGALTLRVREISRHEFVERFFVTCLSANSTVLIDKQRDGHRLVFDEVDWVVKNWPIELFPLCKQSTSGWVLLLRDAQDDEFAVRNKLPSSFVPDWHVLTTAGSPGCEVNQQNALAAKVGQGYRFSRVEVGQREVWMRLADLGCVLGAE